MKERFFILVLDREDTVIDKTESDTFPSEEKILHLLERNAAAGDVTAKIDKRYVLV